MLVLISVLFGRARGSLGRGEGPAKGEKEAKERGKAGRGAPYLRDGRHLVAVEEEAGGERAGERPWGDVSDVTVVQVEHPRPARGKRKGRKER